MWVFLGLDFVGISCQLTEPRPPKAYLGMWNGTLYWTNPMGVRESSWAANSHSEALELAERIKAALPEALATIERRFETWHDLLVWPSTQTPQPPSTRQEG